MYALVKLPFLVEHYAPQFEHLFSPVGYRYFRRYLSGLYVSENKTLEAINRLFVLERRNQSSFNRFACRQNFDLKELDGQRLSMMQEVPGTRFKGGHTGPHGVLSLDDTLMQHWGRHFEGIHNLYDPVKERYCLAHNLVSLHYSDDGTDYPVYHTLWEPPDWGLVAGRMREEGIHINQAKWDARKASAKKWGLYMRDRFRDYQFKVPQLQEVYRTKVVIALGQLRRFRLEHPGLGLPLAMDHGYTSADACRTIGQELGMAYVGSLADSQLAWPAGGGQGDGQEGCGPKAGAVPLKQLLHTLLREHKAGEKRFHKTTVDFKGEPLTYHAYCANHRIKGFGKQRLVISFRREDLSDTPCYSVCNRLNWFASGILRIRRHRWPVETFHQEGKAEGLDKYQVRNLRAIGTHVAFVSIAYSMLKRSAHDPALLSMLLQRLRLEPSGTPPSCRRLMQMEGLMALIEYTHLQCRQGKSLDSIYEQVLHPFVQ